jgi:trk system potassium uptake protein
MNIKGIFYYLGLFCFPITFLSLFNILFSSYFNYFLNIDSYVVTLITSLFFGFFFILIFRKSNKGINFYEQLFLILLIYILTSLLVCIPYYLSNYQIPFINSLFESVSGITGTGFSIFNNIKYLDPTLILWRSSSQWLGGLYFLVFLILFFSNSQFRYKLNNLVFTSDKSVNPEGNINKIALKIFFLYSALTLLIFILFSMSNVRLFNSFNLAMTLISAGGFLPTNSLSQIIKTNTQETLLIFSFLISMLNVFFIFNLFSIRNFVKEHYEDIALLFLTIIFTVILFFSLQNLNFVEILIVVLSSIGNSGIAISNVPNNFSLFLLFFTIIGGSIISNTSGIKFIRVYILLKISFIEILKLVKPNNVFNHNILFSNKKIIKEDVSLAFLVFISFFLCLFFLSGILTLDNINFENSFKLSILTLTNTVNSDLYTLTNISFANLLTNSKIFLIIFMIIGKIELISFFLIIRKIFFKN